MEEQMWKPWPYQAKHVNFESQRGGWEEKELFFRFSILKTAWQ
jgi:hypothetical protein